MNDDQLSRQERTVLDALAESLALDDPAFVERFSAEAQALGRPRPSRWRAPLHWFRRRRGQPEF